MVLVRFIKHMSPYQPGELAGFDEEYAKKLIKEGIAEEVKKEAKPEAEVEIDKQAVAEKDKMVRKSKVEK